LLLEIPKQTIKIISSINSPSWLSQLKTLWILSMCINTIYYLHFLFAKCSCRGKVEIKAMSRLPSYWNLAVAAPNPRVVETHLLLDDPIHLQVKVQVHNLCHIITKLLIYTSYTKLKYSPAAPFGLQLKPQVFLFAWLNYNIYKNYNKTQIQRSFITTVTGKNEHKNNTVSLQTYNTMSKSTN
jgi:hypothetical protein